MHRLKTILPRAVPAVLIVTLLVLTIWGRGGLRDLMDLREKADDTRREWAAYERDNERLIMKLRQLESDPVNVERMVADELQLTREGATLYEFDEDGGARRVEDATTTDAL